MEVLILACLILLNGLFAMSEVALLTARKSRLKTQAAKGDKLAASAAKLAEEPTRFLSTIQIGITSIGILSGIYGEAAIAEPLAVWLTEYGLEPKTASGVSTGIVVMCITYMSIVFGELVPKRLGQHNSEAIARAVAWPMRWLAMASAPFVHLLSVSTDAVLRAVLSLLRIRRDDGTSSSLSVDEIRTIVLESSNILPKKHATILLNLFDLQAVTVDDVMVPRSHIEAIDIEEPLDDIARQIETAYHRRIIVYRRRMDDVLGTIRVRAALALLRQPDVNMDGLAAAVQAPNFVPSGTPLFSQLQNFQETQDRLHLVVDEYGELMGLVTLEDILEEIIGEFTTQSPAQAGQFHVQVDGSVIVEGSALLRDLNRKLAYRFPLTGPKTLNGIILEHLQDIPEPSTSMKIAGHTLEIVQTQDRVVKAVRLLPPGSPAQNPE